MKKAKVVAAKKVRGEESKRMPVSESNLRKAAARLLTSGLVSTEIDYVQRTLGNSATQQDIDANVLAVRKLAWSAIVVAD
ncbi:MAG TPA: hypothetical protein VF266_14960 [Thermoanaerobaculia bacterium]